MLSTEEPYSGIPQLVMPVEEEIICGDMCSRPAINWGKGRSLPV